VSSASAIDDRCRRNDRASRIARAAWRGSSILGITAADRLAAPLPAWHDRNAVWRQEPFRIFFPLGIALAWVGIGHWAAYAAGWISTYSCTAHGLVQIQGFLLAFALGFLLTAIPAARRARRHRALRIVAGGAGARRPTAAAFLGRWWVAEGVTLPCSPASSDSRAADLSRRVPGVGRRPLRAAAARPRLRDGRRRARRVGSAPGVPSARWCSVACSSRKGRSSASSWARAPSSCRPHERRKPAARSGTSPASRASRRPICAPGSPSSARFSPKRLAAIASRGVRGLVVAATLARGAGLGNPLAVTGTNRRVARPAAWLVPAGRSWPGSFPTIACRRCM
jgi:hypothetical protein